MSAKTTARLEIPPDALFLRPAVDFVLSFANRFQRSDAKQASLERATAAALEMLFQTNAHGKSGEPIALEVSESLGVLHLQFLNRGIPILVGAGRENGVNHAYLAKFHEAARNADRFSIENGGRKGQSVLLEVRLGLQGAAQGLEEPEAAAHIPEGEQITLRELGPADADALSRLFYLVYRYDYVHELVYYPEKLQQMLSSGELLSIGAARPNGRLVGHVGLRRQSREPPVFEAAMGVVDPAIASRGLFGQLFARTIEKVHATPMLYLLIDFVTNHELTQKHVARYGTCDLALFVGCQSKTTQARLDRIGIGPDPVDMDRYSLLLSVIPQVPRPFGREITLPEGLGERFGFLLEPLGLGWTPASRFEPLPPEGSFKTSYQPAQSAVVFDLVDSGHAAVERLLQEWRRLLRDGFQYAAVDVPLPSQGLGMLYDLLGQSGFFAAGFIPYRGAQLGFRFQSIGPTKVAFDRICVHSEAARRLLHLVREDYEASCRL
jgi:hypothetical protein